MSFGQLCLPAWSGLARLRSPQHRMAAPVLTPGRAPLPVSAPRRWPGKPCRYAYGHNAGVSTFNREKMRQMCEKRGLPIPDLSAPPPLTPELAARREREAAAAAAAAAAVAAAAAAAQGSQEAHEALLAAAAAAAGDAAPAEPAVAASSQA